MPDTKPAAKEESDSPAVAALKLKRKQLKDKMERVSKLPENPAHDHAATVQRCKDGIAEVDAALKEAK